MQNLTPVFQEFTIMSKRFLILISILILGWFGCGGNNSTPTGPDLRPTVTGMTPGSVSRGQKNIQGTITGTNFTGNVTVTLGDGISISEATPNGTTSINIVFSVGTNAPAGAHTITVVTAAGTASSTTVFSVSNNRVPTASFTVNPEKGATNTLYIFDATKSNDADGSISGYKWDFGDSKTGTGRTTTHKYSAAGTFNITLTVIDNDGGRGDVQHSAEVVNGLAPIAKFTVSPESGALDTTFTFDGSLSTDDGHITAYGWKFGDGATASGVRVTHKFTKAGLFTVALTVTDNTGIESAVDKDVRVESFDEGKNVADIQNVIARFFRRFAELDHLSAETIVEGWSLDPGCPGRDHEIKIIENEQATVQKTTADIISPIDVFIHDSHTLANANVRARFEFTKKDGTKGAGEATHDFSLVFEGGEWMICNFVLTDVTNPGLQAVLQ